MGSAARVSVIGGASVALLLALAAAARPSVLSQTSGGLWELSGAPGGVRQSRQCLRDPSMLTQFQHRRQSNCTRTIVRDLPRDAEVHYSCPGAGFGRSTITMITPRSFRVETQGIAGKAPFHYVLQARRIGNCAVH